MFKNQEILSEISETGWLVKIAFPVLYNFLNRNFVRKTVKGEVFNHFSI